MSRIRVTPFVGAWIEIISSMMSALTQLVTPFVGAWIEIHARNIVSARLWSLPSWERGLKFCFLTGKQEESSHSLRGSVD